jgi:hypothetical protein
MFPNEKFHLVMNGKSVTREESFNSSHRNKTFKIIRNLMGGSDPKLIHDFEHDWTKYLKMKNSKKNS